jgi:dihydroorotate dehydrogenase (fumarate)
VLYSLFEEQLRREAAQNARLADAGTESFAESLSYFPADAADAAEEAGPRRYLSLIERAAAAIEVPVIASLNGVTPGGWTSYSRAMQDAGAAAMELNIYYVPGGPHIAGRDVEQRHIDILSQVKAAVTVPVAVKLSPHFSSTGEIAQRLDQAGADGLVLFNRVLQPDIDPETCTVVPFADLQPSRGPAAAYLDLHPAPAGPCLTRGHYRRRGTCRRSQIPPGRSGRRDDRVRADPARPLARGRIA